jgi:hypothetical protein
MRTPQRCYAAERSISQSELLPCLHCGDLLVAWHSLAWDKTTQTLDGLLAMATRPSRCPPRDVSGLAAAAARGGSPAHGASRLPVWL